MKKRIVFGILVCLGCMPLFGQQMLWTTTELGAFGGSRVIAMNQVKAEILKFAELYDFYTDMSYSFDNYPGGGQVFHFDLQLNGNKGYVDASKIPQNGRQMVGVAFVHTQGIDLLLFHNGMSGMSTSNRRRLELLIDQLITNCR
jgi:hypothetical protein